MIGGRDHRRMAKPSNELVAVVDNTSPQQVVSSCHHHVTRLLFIGWILYAHCLLAETSQQSLANFKSGPASSSLSSNTADIISIFHYPSEEDADLPGPAGSEAYLSDAANNADNKDLLKSNLCDKHGGIKALGMESERIPDQALSASSAFEMLHVGPQNARLNKDKAGGAWCPSKQLGPDTPPANEWIQVDLGQRSVVTGVATQGRYGKGLGQEYTEFYSLLYSRQIIPTKWIKWKSFNGRSNLEGNIDPNTVVEHTLNIPMVGVRHIRLVPISNHTRTVCLRFELFGCIYQGPISYTLPAYAVSASNHHHHHHNQHVIVPPSPIPQPLLDLTYDGQLSESGIWYGGLGQLTDGIKPSSPGLNGGRMATNQQSDQHQDQDEHLWVGWPKIVPNGAKKRADVSIASIAFEFDQVFNFTSVSLSCRNDFQKNIKTFQRASIWFSLDHQQWSQSAITFQYQMDNVIETPRDITIPLQNRIGQFVRIELMFQSEWLQLSEISFNSEPLSSTMLMNMTSEQKYRLFHAVQHNSAAYNADAGGGGGGTRYTMMSDYNNRSTNSNHHFGGNDKYATIGGGGSGGGATTGEPPQSTQQTTIKYSLIIACLCTLGLIIISLLTSFVWKKLNLRKNNVFAEISNNNNNNINGHNNNHNNNGIRVVGGGGDTHLLEHLNLNLKHIPLNGFVVDMGGGGGRGSSPLYYNPKEMMVVGNHHNNDDDNDDGDQDHRQEQDGRTSSRTAKADSAEPEQEEEDGEQDGEEAEYAIIPDVICSSASNLSKTLLLNTNPTNNNNNIINNNCNNNNNGRNNNGKAKCNRSSKTATTITASAAAAAASTCSKTLQINPRFYASSDIINSATSRQNIYGTRLSGTMISVAALAPAYGPPHHLPHHSYHHQQQQHHPQRQPYPPPHPPHPIRNLLDLGSLNIRNSLNGDHQQQQQLNNCKLQTPLLDPPPFPVVFRDGGGDHHYAEPPLMFDGQFGVRIYSESEIGVLQTLGKSKYGDVLLCNIPNNNHNNGQPDITSPAATHSSSSTRLGLVKTVNDLGLKNEFIKSMDYWRELFQSRSRSPASSSSSSSTKSGGHSHNSNASDTRNGGEQYFACLLGIIDTPTYFASIMEHGDCDLNYFLRKSNPDILSFEVLLYLASQLANAGVHLETMNHPHRDIATRNVIIYEKQLRIKLTDGSAEYMNKYSMDYNNGLPIRWMSPESLVDSEYTIRSDVYSFGVCFWEMLTFGKCRPFMDLTDDELISLIHHALMNHHHHHQQHRPHHPGTTTAIRLPRPQICNNEIYELILECCDLQPGHRPTFNEISLFLQRKTLTFSGISSSATTTKKKQQPQIFSGTTTTNATIIG